MNFLVVEMTEAKHLFVLVMAVMAVMAKALVGMILWPREVSVVNMRLDCTDSQIE